MWWTTAHSAVDGIGVTCGGVESAHTACCVHVLRSSGVL